MPTSAEMSATISSTTMLAMSLPLAMRSDWYGCVKKKSKQSAAVIAEKAPGQPPADHGPDEHRHHECQGHVVVVEMGPERDHRHRQRQRTEHADREADEVRAVLRLARASTQRVHIVALSSYGRERD